MTNKLNLRGLQGELDEAVELIESNALSDITSSLTNSLSLSSQVKQTDSLLERCAKVVEAQVSAPKPTLRLIHHFACSGGTLISKCIAAMPNVYVLSETHPLSKNHMNSKPKYSPTDISTLTRYANVPNADSLAKKLFVSNVLETEAFVRERGGELILREHTHIDYCLGKHITIEPTVEECLKPYFNIKHLVSVRNPIDSYMSLSINGWVQFSPSSFNEYCKRLIAFIKRYPIRNIVRYEDFVQNPDKHMKKMCKILDITFNERYSDVLDIFNVTGDSGRKSNEIGLRERRPVAKVLLNEIKRSKNFKKISKMLKYEKDY